VFTDRYYRRNLPKAGGDCNAYLPRSGQTQRRRYAPRRGPRGFFCWLSGGWRS